MFRYERPQAGRLRQFHQIGVECFGSKQSSYRCRNYRYGSPLPERNWHQGVKLHPQHSLEILRAVRLTVSLDWLLDTVKETLSKDSQRRLEENLFVSWTLRRKKTRWQWRVHHLSWISLDEESQAHFDAVRQMLENLGVDYIIDTNMVRGLTIITTRFLSLSQKSRAMNWQSVQVVAMMAWLLTSAVPRLLDLVLTWCWASSSSPWKQGVALPIENALDVYIAVLGEGANVKALN